MKLYNVIVFVEGREPLKYRKVNNLASLTRWLDKNFPAWRYINVYDKVTKEYVSRLYARRAK